MNHRQTQELPNEKEPFFKRHKVLTVVGAALIVAYLMYCLGYVVAENSTSHIPVAAKNTPITSMSVYETINEERRKAGLLPLDYSQALQKSSQAKCNDMAAKNYWNHASPEGKQPQDFVKLQNYEYSVFGENLAFEYHNIPELVSGWMNSPTHKENILRVDYTTTGITVCEGTNYQGYAKTTIVVQHFADPAK